MQKPHGTPSVVGSKVSKPERVFVNLEAVYPRGNDPTVEFSLEELRAIARGWTAQSWTRDVQHPLKAVSQNIQKSPRIAKQYPRYADAGNLEDSLRDKLVLAEHYQDSLANNHSPKNETDARAPKPKKLKSREVRQETQTGMTLTVCVGSPLILGSENTAGIPDRTPIETKESCGTHHDIPQQSRNR